MATRELGSRTYVWVRVTDALGAAPEVDSVTMAVLPDGQVPQDDDWTVPATYDDSAPERLRVALLYEAATVGVFGVWVRVLGNPEQLPARAGDLRVETTASKGYATTDDVRELLGALGGRLPARINVDTLLDAARATVTQGLRGTYGDTPRDFSSSVPVMELLRWAEAKLAAAEVLSAMLVTLPEALWGAPDRLRREAREVLSQPLPGFDPAAGPDPDGDGPRKAPLTPVTVGVSSAAVSLFADPYDQVYDRGARYAPRGENLSWEA